MYIYLSVRALLVCFRNIQYSLLKKEVVKVIKFLNKVGFHLQ